MTNTNDMIKQHPLEVASITRDKTFYVSSALSPAGANDGTFPLMTYGKFSRYEFCAIDENKKAVTSNVRIDAIRNIIRESKEIFKMDFAEKNKEDSSQANLSPAYTVQIKGKIANRTPAQYLKENPNGWQDLLTQKAYLEQNVNNPKYGASNQKQINAIVDAYNLYSAGQLDLSNVSSAKEMVVYDGGMRPLLNRKVPATVKPGCNFVYSLKITWKLGTDNPISVKIENYYAPVIKTDKGLLNVKYDQRDVGNSTTIVFNMSANEWMNVLENIELDMRRFECVNYKANYEEAQKLEKENRNNYMQNQSNQGYQQPTYMQPQQYVTYSNNNFGNYRNS